MKPILVLGPAQDGAPWLERRQVGLRRTELIEEAVADAAGYSSVIVINDRGAGTLERLLLALRLRRRRKPLRIGVLSYLDEAECRHILAEGNPAGGPAAAREPQGALRAVDSRLKVELDGGVLSVEYQAV